MLDLQVRTQRSHLGCQSHSLFLVHIGSRLVPTVSCKFPITRDPDWTFLLQHCNDRTQSALAGTPVVFPSGLAPRTKHRSRLSGVFRWLEEVGLLFRPEQWPTGTNDTQPSRRKNKGSLVKISGGIWIFQVFLNLLGSRRANFTQPQSFCLPNIWHNNKLTNISLYVNVLDCTENRGKETITNLWATNGNCIRHAARLRCLHELCIWSQNPFQILQCYCWQANCLQIISRKLQSAIAFCKRQNLDLDLESRYIPRSRLHNHTFRVSWVAWICQLDPGNDSTDCDITFTCKPFSKDNQTSCTHNTRCLEGKPFCETSQSVCLHYLAPQEQKGLNSAS